jgi:adenylosuccinate lyase
VLRDVAFVIRFGGAVGSYAAMRGHGRKVEEIVARIMGLPASGLGGRADGDRQAEYVAFLGMLAGTCEKVAADLLFLQRTEVAEIEEHHYVGRSGSSTMAQKRNPQEAQRVIMLARMTRSRVPLALESMVREDEGDAVPAHVMDYTLPEVSIFAASMLQALFSMFENLRVRPKRMEQTLNFSGGLIMAEAAVMALGEKIGRDRAHKLVHAAATTSVEQQSDFMTELRKRMSESGIEPAQIDNSLFEPRSYLGQIDELIREVTNPH